MIDAFTCVYNWFRINLLSLNINKTPCVQFKTNNKSTTDINIVCNNCPITTMSNIKFLGININYSLNSSYHVESIIPKLSSACYIMRSIKPYMPINTMKTIYYSYLNTIMSYSLFLWGNSPHSLKIFRIQKKTIRIMTGCNNRASCRNLFRKLEILPLVSQYIFSLMLFVVNNKNLFVLNLDKHNVSVRHTNNSSTFNVY
jgi:hypothetical protein